MKVLKKKSNPRTREILGNTFKSVISNQSCIDGAKTNPLWIAIVFLILGLMLPLIPIMVNASKVQGSSFMKGSRFTFSEVALTSGFKKLYDDGYEFKVNDKNELLMYQNGSVKNLQIDAEADKEHASKGAAYDDHPIYRYTITDHPAGEDPYTQYSFDIYYASSDRKFEGGAKGTTVIDLITVIAGRHYKGKTQNVLTVQQEKELDPKKNEYAYIPSFLLFHKTGVYACICPVKGAAIASSSSAGGTDFTHTNLKDFQGILDRVLTIKVGKDTIQPSDVNVALKSHQEAVYLNIGVLFDEVLETYKWNAFRNNSLIYLGVFAGVELLMGTLVFVLTRGKKNIFNYFNFLTCQKISWYACFTPAVIGLLAGFLFNNQSLMIFIMASGIRIMWLSMKQLRPQ